MKNEEFYIGYLGSMPAGVARFIRHGLLILFAAVVVLAVLLALKQRGFLESTYEYYQDTELSGYLIAQPVPALQVVWGNNLSGHPLIQTIPIVAFGKKGGKDLIEGQAGTKVKARGKLIYYDGKALIELAGPDPITPEEQSASDGFINSGIEYVNSGIFTGEIVDAKCFFGVMKPGHGKPHRSCAIRCISGGIPAVLRSERDNGSTDYHLIVSDKELSPYVGESIEITGSEGNFDDWKVLKIESVRLID